VHSRSCETPPAAEPPEPPPDESRDEGSGFFDWLGGLFGQTKAKPAEPVPAPGADAAAAPAPAAPSTPDRVSAAEGSPETAIEAAWVDHAASLSASRGVPDRSAPPDEDARATVAQAQAASPTPVPQLRPSAASPAPPDPGATGIEVGAEGIAIGAERAAIGADRAALPAPPPEAPRPVLVLFEPGSASLPPGVDGRLEQMLATAKAQGAVIRIEGEAAGAPALALDRARSVALGLMRLGASARDLQMTLAPGASADQARLVLAGPAAAR